jgi:hypothetical protein
VSISDESGSLRATIQYPAHWRTANPLPRSVAFQVESSLLQIIVSLNSGRTPDDSEVRRLHQETVASHCQRLTNLEKRVDANGVRVFEATCYAEQETMVSKYFAEDLGLVVATVETVKPLDRCTEAEVDRLFRDLRLEFARKGSGADFGAQSACPKEVREVLPGAGTCLERAVLGDRTVDACRAELERLRWKENAMAERMIGARTGKVLVCYDRP